MKFGWKDITVWPSAAGNRAERGRVCVCSVWGGRPETDGAAREPSEMNAAHSQGDKLEDDTSHSATKVGKHLTGTLR